MSGFRLGLGEKVVDGITGFEGIVTGRAEYFTGCRQYVVMPPAKDGDFKEGHWFDEDRLRLVVPIAAGAPPPALRNIGGPQSCPAPTK